MARTDPSILDAAVPRMIELYKTGISIKAVGERLGFSEESVRRRLIAANVLIVKKKGPQSRSSKQGTTVLSDAEVERLRKLVDYDQERDKDAFKSRKKKKDD